jgi:selT/selW/selH-like putative selenoprotein
LAATISSKLGVEAKLIKGERGEFEVVVDGDLVFSKKETGRFPEHQEILEKIPA